MAWSRAGIMTMLICNPVLFASKRCFLRIGNNKKFCGFKKRKMKELLSNIKDSQQKGIVWNSPAAKTSHSKSSIAITAVPFSFEGMSLNVCKLDRSHYI
mmetsp:Transcript_4373/g.9814  ORF Transcript_4373/g.9814 Transcript_4373/m.9814 type:complete len:99 (-) Transcript_4373:82-378(-)